MDKTANRQRRRDVCRVIFLPTGKVTLLISVVIIIIIDEEAQRGQEVIPIPRLPFHREQRERTTNVSCTAAHEKLFQLHWRSWFHYKTCPLPHVASRVQWSQPVRYRQALLPLPLHRLSPHIYLSAPETINWMGFLRRHAHISQRFIVRGNSSNTSSDPPRTGWIDSLFNSKQSFLAVANLPPPHLLYLPAQVVVCWCSFPCVIRGPTMDVPLNRSIQIS